MKLRWLGALVLLLAFGAGAWLLLRPPELAPLPSAAAPLPEPAPAQRASADPAKLSAAAVLSIDPRAPTARAPVRAVRASLNSEFLTTKSLKALYDRLNGTPEGQTAEGQYILYEMLRRCATVTEGNARRPFQRALPNRDEFVATLAPNDPQRDKRLAAFDEMDTKRCAGFEGVSITQANLNKLLSDSA